ncbi:hypothetical protein Tco_0681010 [Tanacetum coccineum]|uniref:Uncharacterized protein n=1 Tax=Tanacetum coccineum TaxID=301880 RepID=A0ABQ4XMY5_9ASTR
MNITPGVIVCSSSFDQSNPQFRHSSPPQENRHCEILRAKENLMEAIQAFLKKYDHIPPREKSMDLLLAEERFLKVKQALEEGQNQSDNCPIFDDDDDEEYTIQVREYYKNSSVAITPDFSITNSLIIEDEHLDTIPEMESEELIKSSVENLVLIPKEIDIFLAPDDSIPPGIENVQTWTRGGDLFLEELLNKDSVSLPEYESFHFDSYNVPSSPCPPEKPPDDDIYLDIEPDTGILTTKVVVDIFDNSTREPRVQMPNVLPTHPTFCQDLDFTFSTEFNGSILVVYFLSDN